MNHTGKAGKPRNKPPNLKGETQFDRFVETAKALDAEDGGATLAPYRACIHGKRRKHCAT